MPHTVKERLYVDRDDKVYRESDLNERSEVTLLAPEGGSVSDADVKRYGLGDKKAGYLVSDADAEPAAADADDAEAKAVPSAPANKARAASSGKDA